MRLLDLYCGAGGCAQGYIDAGFDVTGVDVIPQPSYPGRFIQADALTFPLDGFDVVRASPVCKGFSFVSLFHPGTQAKYENHIPAIRQRFIESGKPYEIENVSNAPLIKAFFLCGAMFGLRVYRHRWFESNCLIFQPAHPKHTIRAAGPGMIAKENEFWCVTGHIGQKDKAQRAMGIDWMKTVDEISQAIPRAYTKWIGDQIKLYV